MNRKTDINIKNFVGSAQQECKLGKHIWSVARLFELSRELEPFEIPLIHMNIYHNFGVINLREMVGHFKSITDADLNYPIILDEDGEIMDGRHRLMKALMEGKETIKAVRFSENPKPCRIIDK
jgi:hypothetical protein